MKAEIRRMVNNLFGVDIVRYKKPEMLPLWEKNKVDMIFDVGANRGMSGEYFRNIGYAGRIVSFEPIKHLYSELQEKTSKDSLWTAENIALGDKNESSFINITGGHGGPSSILEMTELLKQSVPSEQVVRKEEIAVKRTEDVIKRHYDGNKLFCKIDTQGYEKKVLEGAGDEINRMVGLKIEMSIRMQYCGEPLYIEMIEYLRSKGFSLISIENGWADPITNELFQIDGLFFRIS